MLCCAVLPSEISTLQGCTSHIRVACRAQRPKTCQPRVRHANAPLSFLPKPPAAGDLLADVDMTPLHRCLHIHACLGRMQQFTDYYTQNRRQQVGNGRPRASVCACRVSRGTETCGLTLPSERAVRGLVVWEGFGMWSGMGLSGWEEGETGQGQRSEL